MASRDTPRGVSPVLRGVCANLLRKRGKAALSYSTPFLTPIYPQIIGKIIFTATADFPKGVMRNEPEDQEN